MAATTIEWCDHSINPIRARDPQSGAVGHYCELYSSGCAHCYASNLQKRFQMPAFPGKPREPSTNVVQNGTVKIRGLEVFLDGSKLQEVLRRKKPTRFFWCDMTDLFGSWVPDEWLDKCFAVMALTPQHTHQVLTKRPERMLKYLTRKSPSIDAVGHACKEAVAREIYEWHGKQEATSYRASNSLPIHPLTIGQEVVEWERWPLPNVWLGVSIEDQQRADERTPWLLKTPAAVRFLSCEPLLGPVDLRLGMLEANLETTELYERHQALHWAIAGGESGPGARPLHPDWARSLRDQCQAAGVRFFFKQWGEWEPVLSNCIGVSGNGKNLRIVTNADGKAGMAMHRVGKKAAGRLLDGREWNEMPEVAHA